MINNNNIRYNWCNYVIYFVVTKKMNKHMKKFTKIEMQASKFNCYYWGEGVGGIYSLP